MSSLDNLQNNLLRLDEDQLTELMATMRKLEKELEGQKPATKEELHAAIKKEVGFHIPLNSVCKGHDAPMDFVWDLFSGKTENALLIACRNGAKCVTGDSLLRDVNTGKLVPIKDVIDNKSMLTIDSLKEDGSIGEEQVVGWWNTGENKTIKITLRSGRTIAGTHEHPMLTPNGYKRLDELKVGDNIASPRKISEPNIIKNLDKEVIELLAILLAEGAYSGKGISFSTSDHKILELVKNACKHIGGTHVKYKDNYDYLIQKNNNTGLYNKVGAIMKDLGVERTTAPNKRIPSAIFQLDNKNLSRFLEVFWMCDGYVSKEKGVPGIALSSKGMIEDIQHLLLRFGVQSHVHKRYNSEYKTYSWKLTVCAESVENFKDNIKLWGHKQEALENYYNSKPGRSTGVGRPKRNNTFDSKVEKTHKSFTWKEQREYANKLALATGNTYKKNGLTYLYGGGTKTVSLHKLRTMCEHGGFNKNDFALELNENIWWDEITSIEDNGIETTYDLTVDKTHNFVVNDLISHNTQTVAILHYMNSLYKPGLTGLTVAATEVQAKRCYNYMTPWFYQTLNGKTKQKNYIKQTNIDKTLFDHGGSVENLPATVRSLNGPHCHPPGQPVLTSDGYIPVEELDSNKHLLASYTPTNDYLTWGTIHGKIKKGKTSQHIGVCKRGNKWIAQVQDNGKRKTLGTFDTEDEAAKAVEAWRDSNPKNVHPFEVTNWDYKGNLVVANNSAGKSRMTPAHKVRVKFTDEFYDSWVVYLMQKGDCWRIGMTKASRLHLRLNEEQGDAIWMLGVYKDKLDAITNEIICQAQYGITGICFTPGAHSNARINNPEEIHNVLSATSNERALQLLKDFDMEPALPLFGRYGHNSPVAKSERFNYSYKKWFVTAVGNLYQASGMFIMPTVTDKFIDEMNADHPNTAITNLSKEPYEGKVYGIEVKPHHFYVADGMVIHNTQFTHADEVEIWEDEQAWKEFQNIPAARKYVNPETNQEEYYEAQVVLTSTRKYPAGRIQNIVDTCERAKKDGVEPPYRIYVWCYAETTQNQSNCREAPENKGRPEEELCNCNVKGSGRWKDGSPRTFNQVCGGKLHKADGYRLLKEVQSTFRSNDQDTWEAQQECKRPSANSNYIKNWDLATHGLKDYMPDPENGPIHMGVDWGATNPNSVLWIQLIKRPGIKATNWAGKEVELELNTFVVFDEIYIADIGAAQLADMVISRENSWSQKFGKKFDVKYRYCDPQGKMQRYDFANKGLETHWFTDRNFESTVTRLRELFKEDGTIFVVQPRCPMLCEEIAVWHMDEKGRQVDVANHSISSLRYCTYNMFAVELIDLSGARNNDDNFKKSIVSGKVKRRNRAGVKGPLGYSIDTRPPEGNYNLPLTEW